VQWAHQKRAKKIEKRIIACNCKVSYDRLYRSRAASDETGDTQGEGFAAMTILGVGQWRSVGREAAAA
jgi:hypothetical protein